MEVRTLDLRTWGEPERQQQPQTSHPGKLSQPVPKELQRQCLAMVEIALKQGSEGKALAAVRRAFAADAVEPITRDSPIVELNLGHVVRSVLDRHGVVYVRDLEGWTMERLATIRNLPRRAGREINYALREAGLALRIE